MESLNIPPTNHINVLDDDQGWVGLLDHMGNESTITNAARVSFGKLKTEFDDKDEILLKYLIENKHMTPLEHVKFTFSVHCPLYVRSQWMRHRACVSGDTEVYFNRPCDGKPYKMKISEIFSKWNEITHNQRGDRQGDCQYKRTRLKNMRIRSLNEKTLKFFDNKIKNVFCNGVKELFLLKLSNGMKIKTTSDHKFFTNNGWKQLSQLTSNDLVAVTWSRGTNQWDNIEKPWFFDFLGKIEDEIWQPIVGYEDKYIISNYGRVKSLVNTRNKKTESKFKQKTILKTGYPAVSLSSNGVSKVYTIHTLMIKSFNLNTEFECVRHLDGNKLNCHIDNLRIGTFKENSEDSFVHNSNSTLNVSYFNVVDITNIGSDVVYDIEVETDNHNYIANGIVVHNCSYNEISRRYTEFEMEIYTPKNYRKQSDNNKQASTDELVKNNDDAFMLTKYINEECLEVYYKLLKLGVCKEQARGVLPQNMMTTFWWTVDLRNLINFLVLRDDSHAQKEIQEYAKAIKVLIEPHIPHVMKYIK